MNKFLITQSLLSAYNWIFKSENGYQEFISTLNRKPIQQNNNMLKGIRFENMVTAYCEGDEPEQGHEWANGIRHIGDILRGSSFQIALSKSIIIENVEFLLYGKIDALKAGTIYDIKFSDKYKLCKYLDSPQHPMYFEICPNANIFTYLVSNGTDVYKETYRKEDTASIVNEIQDFMVYLDRKNLVDTYCKLWKSKY